MKKFTIATWNVNSINVRLPHVLQWLADKKPDVLALQELKLPNEKFPHGAINEIGYKATVNGQKTWNGVALITKDNTTDIITEFPKSTDPQKRVLAATTNDIQIINLYIPNGENTESDKFIYKLAWLTKLKEFISDQQKKHEKIIILGDFNIAPTDNDVWDSTKWQDKVLCSAAERDALQNIIDLGFTDCFRKFPQDDKIFSWWDYRMNGFKRNHGLRIDIILASDILAKSCSESFIDKEPRSWERPSDHTPVVATFDLL